MTQRRHSLTEPWPFFPDSRLEFRQSQAGGLEDFRADGSINRIELTGDGEGPGV
jgi:hypothetical protein